MIAAAHAAFDPLSLVFYGMAAATLLYCAGMCWVSRGLLYRHYGLYFAGAVAYVALDFGHGTFSPSLARPPYVQPVLAAIAIASALRVVRAGDAPWARKAGFTGSLLALLGSWLPLSPLVPQALTQGALPAALAVQMVMLALESARAIASAQGELSAVSDALSSELAAVSQALRTAEEASQRAERATRVRDEFIATMSHEFRTPLNPIINIPQGLRAEFVRLVRAECAQCRAVFELEDDEKISAETACPDCTVQGSLRQIQALTFAGDAAQARLLLTKVEHSGEQLLRVVNGILDFSKMEAGQLKLVPEQFDARAMLRALLRELAAGAQRADTHLALAGDERPLWVHADPQRIREALEHLIDNAIKFRRGPGTVTVSARAEGARVTFSVEDQGIGIAPEQLDSVFTSFEQVSKGNTRSHGGTGLGLTMARALVQMHGGSIAATSEPDVGSTFRFWIPKDVPARASLRPRERLGLGPQP